jgi:hypothetical protein
LTPEEIRSHPLFAKLNERQQTFVDALLRNGNDKVKAAQEAWTCNGEASARTLANRALQNEGIAFLVESFFGKDPDRERFTRDGALEFAASKARSVKDPKLALDFLRLIAAMEGWITRQQEKPPEQPRDDGGDPFLLD